MKDSPGTEVAAIQDNPETEEASNKEQSWDIWNTEYTRHRTDCR
jgi:hypothetical protein